MQIEHLTSDAPARSAIAGQYAARLRPHWPIIGVYAVYALAAAIIPTFAPVATTDDWGYSRPVQILYHQHTLRIFPVVASTAVFQVFWGALFSLPVGPTLGVLRFSTVVMVGLGGLALFGLCRELGVSRGRSALGAAVYLFNPLGLVLAYTFMTDPNFTALVTIATFCYVRGLDPATPRLRWIIGGSAVAASAFLTRQQGVLLPIAVIAYLLVMHRLRPNRRGAALVAQIVGLPLVALIGYYLWLAFVNQIPSVQESFLKQAEHAGWRGTWQLLTHLTFFEVIYLGFFALPLTAGALTAGRRLTHLPTTAGWIVFCAWEAVLAIGLAYFTHAGVRMPYAEQFFGHSGLGPPDVVGSRPELLRPVWRDVLTVVSAAGAFGLGLILCRRVGGGPAPDRAKAGLVLAIALGQVVGVLPPSYHYLGSPAGTLDRYLLPLLPLAIGLALWAARDLRISHGVAWFVVGAYALFAAAGTRDYLVYMTSVWDMARTANAHGVVNTELDAGSAWDGYHLYEYSVADPTPPRTPPGGPWWVYFYAPATDSSYLVAGKPVAGYVVVTSRPYSSWLQRKPARIFLLRRPWVSWPP